MPPRANGKALFFDEGPGYLFIRVLGNGVEGCASLVRNVSNGMLYVRKEESDFSKACRRMPLQTAAKEARIAQSLSDVPGVYRNRGWSKYQNTSGEVLNVTYWEYCNMGSVHSNKSRRRKFSEGLICHWLRDMLATMIDIHNRGIVHHDAHLGNWLIDHPNGNVLPSVKLADFGRASFKTRHGEREWLKCCINDFIDVLLVIAWLLDVHPQRGRFVRGRESRCSRELLELLQQSHIRLQRVPGRMITLNASVENVREAIRKYLTSLRIGAFDRVTERDIKEYATYDECNKRGFKQYKMASVHNQGVREQSIISTGHAAEPRCPRLKMVAQGDHPSECAVVQKYVVRRLHLLRG